jgi:hypothetical protein
LSTPEKKKPPTARQKGGRVFAGTFMYRCNSTESTVIFYATLSIASINLKKVLMLTFMLVSVF